MRSRLFVFPLVVFMAAMTLKNADAQIRIKRQNGQQRQNDQILNIIRPVLVDGEVDGTQIAKPGEYQVTVGDLIELEYSYPTVPTAIPKELRFRSSVRSVVGSTGVAKEVIVPGLTGVSKKAFCFRATSEGTSEVTLNIDGNQYQYSITVEGAAEGEEAGGGLHKPRLCKATYTAIQLQGTVYIFAQGTHPTPGYTTFFKKAPIRVFPPQFSLMCKKPNGMVTQVLAPFSASTSFRSPQLVESVTITDSEGQHVVEVMQIE